MEALVTTQPRRPFGLIGAAGSVRVRWWIFLFMFLFPLLCYVQRNALTIATDQVKEQLHVSQLQVFLLSSVFMIMYTALQLPGGALGQRWGARRMFVLVGAVSCLATVATPLAPYVFTGAAVIVAMALAQAVLGTAQAPVFPVQTGVFESWFPSTRWGFVNGLGSSAMGVGSAIAAPLIVALTAMWGWQRALLWTALPMAVVTVCWAWYGRDMPQQHPGVSARELAELDGGGHEPPARTSLRRCLQLMSEPSMLALALSYLLMNVAFYQLMAAPFLYLTQHRHLGQMDSGWLATLPPLGAATGACLGGALADRCVARFGLRWGPRLVPLVALPAAAILLLCGIYAAHALVAVACFVLAYGCVELNEGPVAAATMQIARADSMSGFGAINTGGNLAGVLLYPLLGYLSGRGEWNLAFLIAAGCCLGSAALWLLVRADRRFAPKIPGT
ncbi:MAG: MFS transporter [Gammaproteobacteria bacterium]|nr:MFS transporter [Gammaproteobacteria bacterium]